MFNDKLSAEKIILAMVILVALGLVAYFVMPKNSLPVAVQPTASPLITPQPTALEPTLTLAPSIDVSDWKTYRNDKYGFELTFPSTWKGYIVETKELVSGVGKYDSINFGFDIQKSLFSINVFTKDQWEKSASDGINNEIPEPSYINKNEKFFFNVGGAQDTENQEMADRMSEIGKILSTFKFIK